VSKCKPYPSDLTGLARIKDGRKPEPTASVIDTRSVKSLNTASRARRCKGPQLRAPRIDTQR
jgi:hypothetical protein